MPVLLYQLWAFVAPGLTPSENARPPGHGSRWPWSSSPSASRIAYVVLPFAVQFLFSFTDDYLIAAASPPVPYFDFVTTMFLAFGLVMEFPILLVGLSQVGIVTSERLNGHAPDASSSASRSSRRSRPRAATSSARSCSGGTMYVLFELTVLFIRRSGR